MIAENSVAFVFEPLEKSEARDLARDLVPEVPAKAKASATFYHTPEKRMTILIEFDSTEQKNEYIAEPRIVTVSGTVAINPTQEYLDNLTGV